MPAHLAQMTPLRAATRRSTPHVGEGREEGGNHEAQWPGSHPEIYIQHAHSREANGKHVLAAANLNVLRVTALPLIAHKR